jgi:hypothetical protein
MSFLQRISEFFDVFLESENLFASCYFSEIFRVSVFFGEYDFLSFCLYISMNFPSCIFFEYFMSRLFATRRFLFSAEDGIEGGHLVKEIELEQKIEKGFFGNQLKNSDSYSHR